MRRRVLAWLSLSVVAACHGEGQDGIENEGGVLDAGPDAGPPHDAGVDAGECVDAGDAATCGSLLIDGLFNQCAKVGGYVFSPLSVVVGSEISISSFAEDEEGDPVTYSWQAPDGVFSHPDASDTSYRCDVAGEKVLKLTVSDTPDCVSVAELNVTCLDAP
ncbi:MAG: hypothetical protein QM778_10670 [Myxococcales bacterium]